MENAIKFLASQRVLSVACMDSSGVWIASVYIGVSDDGSIYFVSPESSRHSQMILSNPKVAFSCAWSDSDDPTNRKGVQGLGDCQIVHSLVEIVVGLKALHSSVPGLAKIITVDWILKNSFGSKLWKIDCTYLKYWDDDLYKDEESKEFAVSREREDK